MNFWFFDPPVKTDKTKQAESSIVTVQLERNTVEGSEFLDDAIRMKDQPLMYTEESIAPGSPEGLL